MAENEPGNEPGQQQEPAKGSEWKPPKDQAEFDRIIGERVARERAKYPDYADLQAKAKRFDEAEDEKATELERATKKAREEGEVAGKTAGTRDRVLDKIEVAAAGKFADVEDARLRVGQRVDEFIKRDGSIDVEAIRAAVEELLKTSPHLAAAAPNGSRPRPDASQGGGGGKPQPGQLGLAEAQKRFGQRAS